MLAQIGREVGETLIPERLDGAHDRRGVDAIAPRQLARRQEIRLLRVVEDLPDQGAALAAERGPREAHLERHRQGAAARAVRFAFRPDVACAVQPSVKETIRGNASTRRQNCATLVATWLTLRNERC